MMHSLETLSEALGPALQAKGWQLALAESCTGGMVSQAVTAIAGSSGWFDRGFVTYSNQSKSDMLGVAQALIQTHGAVSEPVANAMALGAIQHSRAQVSAAITGIAGPTGGSLEKPVGTVCFGWAIKTDHEQPVKLVVETRYFEGDRAAIREQAASYSLTGLLKLVKTVD
ncbi:MAG TPA: CinA family protein [Methylophilus sp.]|nr:CinA family protein [Methylophilus sp.]